MLERNGEMFHVTPSMYALACMCLDAQSFFWAGLIAIGVLEGIIAKRFGVVGVHT